MSTNTITPKIALEIVSHEAIVREAYLDVVGVWTWSVGITQASGHTVHPRYKDNPQTLAHCLEAYVGLLRDTYAPPVEAVFAGHALTEAQFGAALSFHYNTGGIAQAAWATEWMAGEVEAARASFMNWRRPSAIIPRREKERALFFDGVWSSDGTALEVPVAKPSYAPDFGGAKVVDVRGVLEGLL